MAEEEKQTMEREYIGHAADIGENTADEILSQEDVDDFMTDESFAEVDREQPVQHPSSEIEFDGTEEQPLQEEISMNDDLGVDEPHFSNLTKGETEQSTRNLDFILDIPLELTVEMGSTRMLINDLLKLGQGSVIELNKQAGDPLDILVNNKLIARGEVVVVGEKFGIRITDIVSPLERVKGLQ